MALSKTLADSVCGELNRHFVGNSKAADQCLLQNMLNLV